MELIPQSIQPVLLLKPKRFADPRGYFSEIYSKHLLAERGLVFDFVQDNLSYSIERGTVRGLHFQPPPSEQTKLVSVVRGAILDVAVDLRTGSPTYGKHVAVEISADNGLQLLVPRGFAHGFCTLQPGTVVLYKVDAFYDRERDLGLRWNDPALNIPWPVAENAATLSSRDRALPFLAELPAHFTRVGGG